MRHTTKMRISFPILAENVSKIQALAPKAKLCPMVKGNAYGHGIVEVSRFLLEKTHVQRLGVASLGEAQEILECLGEAFFERNPALDIVVFSDTELLHKEFRQTYFKHPFVKPVVSSLTQLEAALTDPELAAIPLLLKVNTGMNRLGIPAAALMDDDALVERLKARGIYHLLQHFSVGDEPATPDSGCIKQFERFQEVKKHLASKGVAVQETSTSNSGAICQGVGVDETYVRPGLILYGPQPGCGVDGPLFTQGRMVANLCTKVLHCFHAKKGETIGYGHFALPRDGFVVMIPFGYADGMMPCQPGKRRVCINGHWGTLFGKINMDISSILLDEAPTSSAEAKSLDEVIKPDDDVELWGGENCNARMAEVAREHDTIPYQIMCMVSVRVPRDYIEE